MTDIRLQLTEADAVAAYRLYYGIVMRRRRLAIWLPLMIIVVISLLYGTGHSTSSTARTIATMVEIAGVVVACWTLIFFIAYFVFLPRRARRGFRQNQPLRESMIITIDDEALHIVQPSATGRRRWATFLSWAENGATFLLLSTDQLFFFMPKRVLTADHLRDMRANLARAGIARARTYKLSKISVPDA